MKKVLICATWMALMFTSCSKNMDFSAPSDQPIKHAESVFGVQFDSNHTWSSTTTGDVVIKANSTVKKVQVLAIIESVDEDGDTYTQMTMLNEAELNGNPQVTLRYDAPSKNIGLYVAFISDTSYIIKKIEGNTVSLDTDSKKTIRRAQANGVVLPTGEFKLAKTISSFASDRGWVPGELLYDMSDESYQQLKMAPVAYSQEMMNELKTLIMSHFTQKGDNLQKVKTSNFYNEKSYPISTGYEPIIVTPFYKQDGAPSWGPEVYNSDLYYYYFKEEDLGSDPVAYIKGLPKYKAIPFNQYYKLNEDQILEKRHSYALIYWGDGVPTINETVGTFNFPKGYKIGFMVRSKTIYTEGGKGKSGEFYLDGRLNDHINSYGMLGTAAKKLQNGDPRGSWLTFNDHMFLCFETGADRDFNEIIMEVEGGIEGILSYPEPDANFFTYCFEDTENGDYDMNDVVIKATRKNNTTVEYSIIACGARDELYVKNINSGVIQEDKEIHSLFGQDNKPINTEKNATKLAPITVTKTVPSNFSMADPNTQPYVFNKTKNLERRISRKGEDPHALMIPNGFLYPLEKVCIKDAYLEFNNWGQNPVLSTDWYTKPVDGKVYNK